jgi:hypothetical protein
MKLNKFAMVFLVVGVVLIGLVVMKKKAVVQKDVPLQEALKATLPAEAQGKLLINQDRVNVGKQYISVIHNVQDDSKVKETVSKFIYQAFSRLDSKEMENISAVNIVLYQMIPPKAESAAASAATAKDGKDKVAPAPAKPQTKQYRILIGANVAKKQPESFWSAGDQTALFKWLTATCPTTDSRNLTDFCDISSSLKE